MTGKGAGETAEEVRQAIESDVGKDGARTHLSAALAAMRGGAGTPGEVGRAAGISPWEASVHMASIGALSDGERATFLCAGLRWDACEDILGLVRRRGEALSPQASGYMLDVCDRLCAHVDREALVPDPLSELGRVTGLGAKAIARAASTTERAVEMSLHGAPTRLSDESLQAVQDLIDMATRECPGIGSPEAVRAWLYAPRGDGRPSPMDEHIRSHASRQRVINGPVLSAADMLGV